MGADSKIEWTHHTFNPWRGCTKVSEGCRNCYAETMSKRNLKVLGQWGPAGTRVIASESMWREPLKWNRDAAQARERRRVFCASLADVFEGPETMPSEAWPDVVSARARLIDLIHRTPHLDWLLLTKRPQNVQTMWDDAATEWGEPGTLAMPLPNVWIGTSVEDQASANERIPHLLRCPAAVRFLSVEPLIGPVDLLRVDAGGFGGPAGHKLDCIRKGFWSEKHGFVNHSDMHDTFGPLHWVIVGGESGPGARACDLRWIRSIVRQCQAAGVPCFVKQLGSRCEMRLQDMTDGWVVEERRFRDSKGGDPSEWPADLRVREFPDTNKETA